MSKLALELIEENKRTKDTFLDLGNCGLYNKMPKELLQCGWVTDLNLGTRYFDKKKEQWADSKNKGSKNIFRGDELSILQSLTQLKSLNLSYNQIHDISFLKSLSQLQSLDLRYTQIQNYSFLQSLTQLRSLNLSHNQIQDISFLHSLTQLQSLYLKSNKINNIKSLEKLTQLQTLYIGSNKIQDISFLEKLTQLRALNLNSNQIEDIIFLENLILLNSLDLSYNQIEYVSSLEKLTQLQSLNLRSNKIKDIHYLEKLTKLQALDLSHNKIQNILYLEKLTQLQTLDLSDNKILDIKPTLHLIKNGLKINLELFGEEGILLYGNPIVTPPVEILNQGSEAIARYFDRIEQQGKDFIFEAKLTLVGDGGSGKTSLQRRIIDAQAKLPTGNDRTRGIKVYDWQFKDANGKTYISHIWDFGGQDVYYPVHRFFLTENSLYILMASTRYAAHNFEYWIPTIYQFGGSSPIILVQTCDNGNQKDWTDIKPFYGIPEYNLKPIYKIDLSSVDNKGLKNLKGFIQYQITELPHIGKPVPKSWVKVREQLIEKAKTNDYISFEKFSDLCTESDQNVFNRPVDIEDLARFLHDLGIILWYYNKDLLRNLVILNPEWAMNAVYRMIDDIVIQKQNGIINQADFNRIWGEETYHTKIGELKLMLQIFKIAFPKQHKKQNYILPARLQAIPDEKLWSNDENSLRLEYHFDFMPRGIVNQLSADLSNEILSDASVWSNAVILKLDNSTAQITEEIHKKKILIKAKGNDARGLIILVMNYMLNIIKEYRGVVPLLRVPCNCKKCQTLEKPTIFEYEKLVGWLNDKRKEVTCNESDTKLFIFQLLYSVGLEHTEDKKEREIKNQVETMEHEPILKAKKVFVTYCWTDKDGKNDPQHQTKVHSLVNALRKRGFDATFDRALNDASTATNFIRMMVDNMYKNDKVIVVLSEGYAVKANEFKGGAGEEYELIINEIKENKNKYILVTFSGRSKEIYPFGLKGRDTIDLSQLDSTEIENLIRKLKGLPSIILDDIGTDTNSYNPSSAPPLF